MSDRAEELCAHCEHPRWAHQPECEAPSERVDPVGGYEHFMSECGCRGYQTETALPPG